MSSVALVLAAGQGLRLGKDLPKAFVRLGGRSLLERSAAALGRAPGVGAVLPVVPPKAGPELAELARGWRGPARLLEAVEGGPTRQASLRQGLAGLAAQQPDAEWLLVHDAARPFVRPEDASAILAAARATGAAVPVVPIGDTLKEVEGDRVVRTPERRGLVLVQTPQAFRRALLEAALEKAERDGFQGTDCASLVERIGAEVRTHPGRVENFKLTNPFDFVRAQAVLRSLEEEP